MTAPYYHVHFGAGKLGLGLVIPILNQLQVPFAIFQRPRGEWEKILQKETIDLATNGQPITQLICVTDKYSGNIQQLLESGKNLFVSTSRKDLLQSVLSITHTFSTAVGPTGLLDVLRGLELIPDSEEQRSLARKVYTFENDNGAVSKFTEQLKKYPLNIEVIPTMCDRICTSRDITDDGLLVNTESFAGLAVLCDPKESLFERYTKNCNNEHAPQLVITHSEAEQRFFYQKKLMMVNGSHMIMAMWTYIELHNRGEPFSSWPSASLHLWETEPSHKEDILLICQARILHLLHQTSSMILLNVFGTTNYQVIFDSVWDYAQQSLGRIASQSDSVGRILNLNDATSLKTKYQARFCDLKHFVYGPGYESMLSKLSAVKTNPQLPSSATRVKAILSKLHRNFLQAIISNVSNKRVIYASTVVPVNIVYYHMERKEVALSLALEYEKTEEDREHIKSLLSGFDMLLPRFKDLISDSQKAPTWIAFERNYTSIEHLLALGTKTPKVQRKKPTNSSLDIRTLPLEPVPIQPIAMLQKSQSVLYA